MAGAWSVPLPAQAQSSSESESNDPALRDYLAGNGLLNRGLYELAGAEYRKFLSQHPNHEKTPVARYGLGVSLFRLTKYDEAVRELEPLGKRKSFTYGAEVGTVLGQCHLAMRRYGPAAEAFESAVTRYGDHELADDASAGCAEALYLAGKHDESIARCEVLVSRWPDSPLRERAEFFWGLALMAKGEYGAGAVRLSKLLRRFPKGQFADRASLLLAQCHHRTGVVDRAVEQYHSIIKAAKSRYVPEAMHGLALLAQQQDNPKEAGGILDQLLRKYPNSPLVPSAQLHRGRAWFDLGKFDRAFDVFKQISKDNVELRDDAAYWMAKCKLRQGAFDEAAKRLGQAVGKYPKSDLLPEMLYDRAVALVQADERETAVKVLSEFRSRFPKHAMAADALHLLGATEHQRERYDQSLGYCRMFLKQYPSHELAPTIAFLAGENDFLAGRYDKAVDAYRTFLSAHPNDPQADKAGFRLGTALHRLDRLDEALDVLAKVKDRGDEDAVLRTSLMTVGDIHFQRGEWKNAERHLTDYLARGLDVPSADDALLKLGLARQRQGRYEAALSAYDTLLERFDKSPHRLQAVFERGQSLVSLERHAEANSAFERVLDEGRDSRFATHALNHLGSIALKGKDYEEAAKRFAQVVRASEGDDLKAEALFQRGQALTAGGQFRSAEKVFMQYLDEYGDGERAPQACARLAIAQARQDRHEDALKTIKRVERQYGKKIDPSLRAAVVYEKAWCLRELGKTDEAVRAYRDLLSNHSKDAPNVHAVLELAEMEAAAKRYQSAVDLLEPQQKAMEDGSAEVPADVREASTYRLAVCFFELGEFERTARLLEEFGKEFPDSSLLASAGFFCGEALFKTGKHERAAKHLTRVVREFPSDPACGPGLLRLGECLATLQRWSGSERVFAEFLDRFGHGEHWFQAQFGVGWARENQSRYDEAVAAYRGLVERHQGPTAARAQFQIGECLFAQKKYEQAVRELLKVDILYAYPQWSAAALYEAGRCFEKLSQPEKARQQFEAVARKYEQTQWADLASKRLAQASAGSLPGR